MSPLANMLIQIKNAQIRGLEEVLVPASGMKRAIAMVLQKEGFLANVEDIKKKGKKSELPYLSITLKPDAIHDVLLISKPSRRMYAGNADMGRIKNGFGTAVISTPKGIMTSTDARAAGVGGEVLFEIW
ncbi:MAG: 30S ribosomal protein S8 [Patescibacteria group bacterium]